METFFMIVGAGAVGAILSGIFFLRKGKTEEAKEPFFYFRCPNCEQKLRYLARLAGKQAHCPRCRQASALPAKSQLKEDSFRVQRQPVASKPQQQAVAAK